MAMKTNFGQLPQGDSIEKDSSRTVTFSPKQSKVKGPQVTEVYPPIRFNSRTSMWGGIASNLIVGRESSAFKDELLQSHELFKGTFMKQNKRSFVKDDRDTNRKPWTWIVEQYENEQQEKRFAERHVWATASPAKSDQSGSKLDHTVSRFEPEAINLQKSLQIPTGKDGSTDTVYLISTQAGEDHDRVDALRTPSGMLRPRRSISITDSDITPIRPRMIGTPRIVKEKPAVVRWSSRRTSFAG